MKIFRRRGRYSDPGESMHTKRLKFNRNIIFNNMFQWFVLVLVAIIVGYAFIAFCFQTVTVIGPSMSPTLEDEQVVVVNKLAYRFHSVERYDVIAYSKVGTNSYYEIKRVIGLPGETVQIRDGYVYINGTALMDIPIQEQIANAGIATREITLGSSEYFVLGDNVNNSEDSRYSNVGNIGKSEILGRVDYILRPKSDRGKVD